MDWYPKSPKAYRADTWGLSLAAHGAYNLLIDYYMLYETPLPTDDKALASIIGVGVEEWLKVRPELDKFFTLNGATIHIDKCDRNLNEQKRRSRQKSANARKGGLAKHAKARGTPSNSAPALLEAERGAATGQDKKGKDIKLSTADPELAAACAREGTEAVLGLKASSDEQKTQEQRAAEVGLTCLDILGHADDPAWHWGAIHQLLADGADPEKHIYPVLRAARDGGKIANVKTLAYFRDAVMERVNGSAAPSSTASDPDDDFTGEYACRDWHEGYGAAVNAEDRDADATAAADAIMAAKKAGDVDEANRLGAEACERWGRG